VLTPLADLDDRALLLYSGQSGDAGAESDHDKRRTSEHDNRWHVLGSAAGVNAGGLPVGLFDRVVWRQGRVALSPAPNPGYFTIEPGTE
jgi:hypothetical protein